MSSPTATLTFPEGHHVKGVSFETGLFINNKFINAEGGKTFDTVDPATGKVIATVASASANDVDAAVKVAQHAYDTVWGEKTPGHQRGKLLMDLAYMIEEQADLIASIESIDSGKPYTIARGFDVAEAAACLRYYGGWADKDQGKVIEVNDSKLAYTRHEPLGVVGQIIPWNFPILMLAWKIGPAVATGNCVIIKVASFTPLSALYVSSLIAKIFPPGVINIISGSGSLCGAALSSHMDIQKIAFTGSTSVGRTIMRAAVNSNLKNVTLELGGKSPNIVFDDADLEAAAGWAAFGIFFNAGQVCCAGSRVYVQEGVYDKFLALLTAKVKSLKVGSPFASSTFQGPQTSQEQFNSIMADVQAGVEEGAVVQTGGVRHGSEGFFIEPTIFTNVKPTMKIVTEEIFGPVLVVSKFKDEDDVVALANDSIYGLAAAVHSRDISRAITTAHRLHAGTVWVNCYNQLNTQCPFGGYKQSGIGRELGEYALHNYTAVKAVHVNLTAPSPL